MYKTVLLGLDSVTNSCPRLAAGTVVWMCAETGSTTTTVVTYASLSINDASYAASSHQNFFDDSMQRRRLTRHMCHVLCTFCEYSAIMSHQLRDPVKRRPRRFRTDNQPAPFVKVVRRLLRQETRNVAFEALCGAQPSLGMQLTRPPVPMCTH